MRRQALELSKILVLWSVAARSAAAALSIDYFGEARLEWKQSRGQPLSPVRLWAPPRVRILATCAWNRARVCVARLGVPEVVAAIGHTQAARRDVFDEAIAVAVVGFAIGGKRRENSDVVQPAYRPLHIGGCAQRVRCPSKKPPAVSVPPR